MMIPVPDVSRLDAVFGGGAMQILPPWTEIPEEFRQGWDSDRNQWCRLARDWFFFGLKNDSWTPREGVDPKKALLAVACCLSSFEPSHEHKIAGVGYLLSQWFVDATYDRGRAE